MNPALGRGHDNGFTVELTYGHLGSSPFFLSPSPFHRLTGYLRGQVHNIRDQKTATIMENYKCASDRPFHFCLAKRSAKNISIDVALKFLFADTFS